MANDFKRMWTKEEIDNTHYIKQQYEYDTPYDITEEEFKKITNKNVVCFINNSNDKEYFYKVTNYGENEFGYRCNTGRGIIELRVIHEEDEYFYIVFQTLLVLDETFENLVSVTQRRLDKPTAEWNSETSNISLKTFITNILNSVYVGQMFCMRGDTTYSDYEVMTYYVVVEKNYHMITLRALSQVVVNENNTKYSLETIAFNIDDVVSFNGYLADLSGTSTDREWDDFIPVFVKVY